MIPPDVAGVFFLASVALGLAPGPDNIFVLTQSALHGRLAGILVTAGLCSGLLVHSAVVAFGVAALLQASPAAFTALTLAGAAYLLYLAWQALRAGASAVSGVGEPKRRPLQLYGRGVVMNVTNPKVTMFFLAFLPQFADPAQGSMTAQIFLLGGIFLVATLAVFGAIAWGGGTLGAWLRRSARAQVMLNRTAAAVFVALALRLAAV